MNLQEIWENTFDDNEAIIQLSKQNIKEAIQKDSQSQLTALRRKMKQKLIWAFSISAAVVPLIFLDLYNPEYLLVVGIIEAIFIIPSIILYIKYRQLRAEFDYSQAVLTALKDYYKQIKGMLRFEEITYIFLYPVSAVGGMCFSLVLAGSTLEDIFSDTEILTIMLVYSAIAVPLGALFAHYWNKRCFGKNLTQLRDYIAQLEGFGIE